MKQHDEAIRYVNRLVMDLKLQLLGQEPTAPIDMARLKKWHEYVRELEQCAVIEKHY